MKPATSVIATTVALSSNLAFTQIPPTGIGQRSQSENIETEIHHLISSPKNSLDFLKNISYIFDHDLLLTKEFYSNTEITESFSINRRSYNPQQKNLPNGTYLFSAITSDFVGIFPNEIASPAPHASAGHIQLDSTPIATASILIDKRVTKSGKISAGINFSIRRGGPDFYQTMAVLNKNLLKIVTMPPHGKNSLPITGPHGDETWTYEIENNRIKRNMAVSFGQDGNLTSILIEIEKIEEGQK